MHPPTVDVQRVGAALVVTIDRAEARNAVDRPTAEALEAAFRRLDTDDEVAVGILTGAGGTFCAGADLHALTDPDRRNRLTEDEHGPMGPSRLRTRKPVIAAVEGYAVAGGLELACWADLRVVAEDATFGVFCRRWGVPLIDGGTVRLPRLVGQGVALDLILTGRPVDATEALRIGLATTVVPAGTTLPAALELAERLAAFPRTTMLADLASARTAFDVPLDEALLREHRTGVAAIAAGGLDEGVAAFQAGAGRHGADATAPAATDPSLP
ncbi:crotonase/enoyl-CoA hydratase family protein [Nitriliruptoraceae bacterium ZYF776]|nr:crotonase/enoyl-CoA hydratase family protein [Profundirhabdus halotolerans]